VGRNGIIHIKGMEKMKRLINAENLMHRVEANYNAHDGWYDLVRMKTLIDTEPTVHPDKHQLAEVVLIFIILVLLAILLLNNGVMF
jgi:hypothetical protein